MNKKQAHETLKTAFPDSSHCINLECWAHWDGAIWAHSNIYRVSILPFHGKSCEQFASPSLAVAVQMALEATKLSETSAARFINDADQENQEVLT